MTYTDTPAVYALNSYVWKLCQVHLGWSTANYPDNRVPLIPAQMDPEFATISKPYIVYGFSTEFTPDMYLAETELVGYTIYSPSATEVTKVVKMLTKALRRKDDSAADINEWIRKPANPQNAAFQDLHFKYCEVTSSQGPGPRTSEGGRVDGLVVVRYSYAKTYTKTEFKV